MTYHRGTLAEFNTWHQVAKVAAGIPAEGRIGSVNGKPAPDNQRTTAVSRVIIHPTNKDDYIWSYGEYPDGDDLSISEVKALGWFGEDDAEV